MNISKDSVVIFHYSLTDTAGEPLEDSGKNPVAYLHGHDGMLPALEKALEGKTAGEKFELTLPAAEAYGERQADREQRIPRKHIVAPKKPQVGSAALVQTKQGRQQVTVLKLGHTMVTVDTNHPYAGMDLVFKLEIVDVRPASAEELAHGHAHGPGGHHH